MIRVGLGLLSISLLVGCASKEHKSMMEAYENNKNAYTHLQKTEKVQFKENNLTKLLVTATYINKPTIDLNDESKERFVIGVSSEDEDIELIDNDDISIALLNVLSKKERREKRDKKRALRIEKYKAKLSDSNVTLLSEDENETMKKDKYLEPLSIVKLDNFDKHLEGISFVSDWTQFYLVTFKHIAGNRLILRVKSRKSNAELALDREKAAKALAKKKKKKNRAFKKSSSKKKKIQLYNIKTFFFAKVAKYAL